MAIIVKKFGGTSVGSVQRIQNVANRIITAVEQGHQVVGVVSAMGKTTDELVKLASDLSTNPSKREMDMLLTTGEQISISLLTIALQQKGYEAVSLTGWQAGVETESIHGNARILNINHDRIKQHLNQGKIVIVAGFQGSTTEGEITTLGRGGSDTTAVALAASLDAEKCDIYTDVPGVFTTDPRFIKSARKLHSISYDEMLEMANLGAGVLHPRAVEFAKNYDVALEVKSSIEVEPGTVIEEEASMEKGLIVRGIAFEDQVTRLTLKGLTNNISDLSNVFMTLADHNVDVDIIIQSVTEASTAELSFSIKTNRLEETKEILMQNQEKLSFTELEYELGLSKVSIVGSGMVSNPGVAAKMFKELGDHFIPVKMVSTSEIKVSTVVPEKDMIKAAETLHEVFQLETPLKTHA